MAAPQDTNLRTFINVVLATQYKRTDIPTVPEGVRDNIDFTDIQHALENGNGDDRANLQFHTQRNLINTSETLDLDGVLTNKWGQTLDYDAVKALVIFNRETEDGREIKVNFKDEQYNIGPQGSRTIIEPNSNGIASLVSSQSTEEGMITVVATGDVTYDIFIIGSFRELTSSSG